MRITAKQKLCALALAAVLALPGCAGTAVLAAQGPTVDAAALHGRSDCAAVPSPAAQGPEAPDPAPTPTPSPAPAVLVPAGQQAESDAARLLAILSGLGRLRASVTDYPVRLAVRNILQMPELPNGCEVTAAAIVLNYLGVPADKMTLARDYLPCSEDFWHADPEVEYMGSPFAGETGYYCMPAPVAEAVNTYLADAGRTDLLAQDISGADIETLKAYLHAGTPVIVWVTQRFEQPLYASTFWLPNGSSPYINLHCVVLTGYDAETFYLADPLCRTPSVDAETFTDIYEAMGRRALVIAPE